jgi:protoheme IX farnesyltransferase
MSPRDIIQSAVTIPGRRALAFVALAKPELTLMSVLTAVGGAAIAGGGASIILLHVLLGTILVGGAAGTLNMVLEREYDGLMKRTARRPIPSGRVSAAEGALFGVFLGISGVVYLWLTTTPVAALLALLTLVTYLFLYTPLKRLTPFVTIVGAIPGALPPVIGWSAVRGEVDLPGLSLFAILFFWQMPHFFSLAWIYRKDYERGGYRMLTVLDPEGHVTGRQIVIYCLALIPASVLPTYLGLLGIGYFVGALALSAAYLWFGVAMYRQRSVPAARRLFSFSLLYLLSLMALMILDRV